MTHENKPTAIQALVLQWQAIANFLVNFGRRVERLSRAGNQDALRKVEELELMTRAALVPLNRQVNDLMEQRETLSPEDENALKQLQAITAGLLTLTMFAMQMREELEAARDVIGRGRYETLRAIQNANAGMRFAYPTLPRAKEIGARGYLDSS